MLSLACFTKPLDRLHVYGTVYLHIGVIYYPIPRATWSVQVAHYFYPTNDYK